MRRARDWSRRALECVRAADAAGGEFRKEYRTACMNTPALLQRAGPVQAVAFLRSRKEAGRKAVIDDLARVYFGLPSESQKPSQRLLEQAQELDLAEYLVLSRSLMTIAVWMRRFAQSELPTQDPAGIVS